MFGFILFQIMIQIIVVIVLVIIYYYYLFKNFKKEKTPKDKWNKHTVKQNKLKINKKSNLNSKNLIKKK